MPELGKKNSIIKYKLIYTAIILSIYMLGRCVPLYGIDISLYKNDSMNAGMLLVQAISGDINRCSVFALGISPYLISSILVQIVMAIRQNGTKNRISPRRINAVSLAMTLGFAFFQAVVRVNELTFSTEETLLIVKVISVVEMVTGVMLIVWLCGRNGRYGFGRQTVLIYVNIIDGIMKTLSEHKITELILPLIISVVVVFIILIMESTEKRIPVQRISIHNIYADKNYLAIKMNPVGAMPVMFSTAFFMLPQLLIAWLGYLFPGREGLLWWKDNMALTRPLGIAVYILILYLLTIGFAMLMLSPKNITEQFLKSGDSIVNLHAGRDTRRYLTRETCLISFLSATVMGICLGIPMLSQLKSDVDSSLVMLPASIMMLTGMWYNLYQEYLAVKSFDAYKPFI